MIDALATWEQVAFIASFTVIATSLVWNLWLFRLARSTRRLRPEPGGQNDDASVSVDDFTWVFLVPAMNEEVTIADSVERLLEVRCRHRHIMVIDDGSTDRTPDVLATISDPDLVVLRRNKPHAQVGKADALNDAWRRLPSMIPGIDPSRTIVCVVDADGRLDPDSPAQVAELFADASIGGVQVRVRIYNRESLLTKAQDIEFGVYGLLYQAARSRMGTAGMGGNGQFNRLATLDNVAERRAEVEADHDGYVDADRLGPWRDTLTEDQDIGLRMLAAGWRCGHDNRVSVHQQGVSNLRRLLRQRTRWAQGNLQAMSHLRSVPGFEVTRRARLDLIWALLQPIAGTVVGIGVFAAVWAWVTRGAGVVPDAFLVFVVFFLLGFGGVVLGVAARSGRGPKGWLLGILVGVAYSAYTWLLWPVLVRAMWRQLRAKRTWAKTEREAIETSATASP